MSTSGDQQTLPDEKIISEVANFELKDESGSKVIFGQLFAEQKTIVVFVRHFFCGMCQAYVSQIASSVPQASLDAAGVKLIIIGCGEPQLIAHYRKETGFTGPMYADPSRVLYEKLGMMTPKSLLRAPAGEERPSYVTTPLLNAFKSAAKLLTSPLQWGKQGHFYQNGGEFIFGPGNVCQFAHIMKHSTDHAEVADVMRAAGVNLNTE